MQFILAQLQNIRPFVLNVQDETQQIIFTIDFHLSSRPAAGSSPPSCLLQDCGDHSTGDFCERCEDGYMMAPDLSGRHTCRPCACPLSTNKWDTRPLPAAGGQLISLLLLL